MQSFSALLRSWPGQWGLCERLRLLQTAGSNAVGPSKTRHCPFHDCVGGRALHRSFHNSPGAAGQPLEQTPTLTSYQATRVRKILRRRQFNFDKGARFNLTPLLSASGREMKSRGACMCSNEQAAMACRKRELALFKQEVRTGQYDTSMPVMSWFHTVQGNRATQAKVNARTSSILPESLLVNAAGQLPQTGDPLNVLLPGSIFCRPVNPNLLHQVVRWQRAKRRQVCLCTPCPLPLAVRSGLDASSAKCFLAGHSKHKAPR